ncbi:MAG: PDZ domain-containing protein [Bacteroidales bacterium]|nr:PDZ domain-containing protein [Bacteroidales bacterium]
MSFRHLIIRFFAVVSLVLFSVVPSTAQRYKSITLSRHDFVDTVKIKIWNGAAIIPVEIEGKVKNLMFDSGAPMGFWIAGEEEWMEHHDTMKIWDSNKQARETAIVNFPQIKMGSTIIGNYEMCVDDGLKDYVCDKIDGAFGFNLVARGLSFKFDTKDSLMIVTDRKGFFSKESKGQPALKYDGITNPRIWVNFPYSRVRMGFDMGYIGGWVNLPQLLLDRWSASDKKMKKEVEEYTVQIDTTINTHAGLFGTAYDTVASRLLHFPAVGLGKMRIKDLWISTGHSSLIVGSALLKQTSLIIDASKKRFVFLPHDGKLEITADNEGDGVSFVVDDAKDSLGALMVVVRKNSKGYQHGFRTGDYLISVNGTPIPDYCTYVNLKLRKDSNQWVLRTPEGVEKVIEW